MRAEAMTAVKKDPCDYHVSEGRLYNGSGEAEICLYFRTCREIILQTPETVYLTADSAGKKGVDFYAVSKRRQTAAVIAGPVTEVSCFFQMEDIACFITTAREKRREYQEVVVMQRGFIRSRFFGPHLISSTGKAEVFSSKGKAFVVLSDCRGQEYVKGKPRLVPKLDGKETTVLVMRFHFGETVDLRYERFMVPGSKVGVGAVNEPELAIFVSPQDGPARLIR